MTPIKFKNKKEFIQALLAGRKFIIKDDSAIIRYEDSNSWSNPFRIGMNSIINEWIYFDYLIEIKE